MLSTFKMRGVILAGLLVFSFICAGRAFTQDITIEQNTTWGAGTYTYEK